MPRRVHQLAKDLGVKSTAIVDKCINEGLDIKNHMSTLSAGLEATIREWFSEGEHSTAVETSARVDLKKVKAKKPRQRKKKEADKTDESSDSAVAVQSPDAAEGIEKIVTVVSADSADKTKKTARPKRKSPKEVATVADDATDVEKGELLTADMKAPDENLAPGAPDAAADSKTSLDKPDKTEPTVAPKKIKPPEPFVPAPAQLQGPKVVRMERPDVLPDTPSRQRKTASRDAAPEPSSTDSTSSAGKRRKAKRHVSLDDTADDSDKSGKRRSPRRRSRRGHELEFEAVVKHEWGDRDLMEREARLAQASGTQLRGRERRLAQDETSQTGAPTAYKSPRIDKAVIKEPITVKELSAVLGIRVNEIIQKLMQNGILATVNQTIDADAAQMIALDYGIELTVEAKVALVDQLREQFDQEPPEDQCQSRPPIVAFLGHVDHGKTSLLDRIRQANVVKGEAGGITQHIGSYLFDDGKRRVTFLDTPGHKAFTAMRARGANMTDIVVLVVAADDGVMPQTEEAINHAKAAGVSIVVALNKIDLPNANEHKIFGELSEHGLVPAEWGGDTEVVRTSAVTGEGIDNLIEHLDYVAELNHLKAKSDGPATGWIVESEMATGQGVLARMLVKSGSLSPGDFIVSGASYGKVRTLVDATGKALKKAGPSMPIEVTGFDSVPVAGDRFFVVESITRAKEIAEESRTTQREMNLSRRRLVTLENLFGEIASGEIKEFNIIVKADVQGSVDVLSKMLLEMNTEEVAVRILHNSVGGITESDVLLAAASNAIIIGFNVVTDEHAKALAESEGVEVRLYRIIYQISDDLRKALEGMLTPDTKEKVLGQAEVRQIFRISRIGVIAGCFVTQGIINRSARVRLIRESVVVRDDIPMETLRRGKDDASEVRNGLECGIKLASFDDIKIGDVIEAYEFVKVSRTLEAVH